MTRSLLTDPSWFKVCFKCNENKHISEFYKHPKMADGHLGKCKACTKRDVSNNYADKRDQYRDYEKRRQQQSERRLKEQECHKRHNERNPEKAKARHAVHHAVRSGILEKQPCRVCGTMEDLHAHHTDYSRPLDVEWYCAKHHRMTHGKKS